MASRDHSRFHSHVERLETTQRLHDFRDRLIREQRSLTGPERTGLKALRDDVLEFRKSVRNSQWANGLATAGIVLTMSGPLVLFTGPGIAILGVAMTIAGPPLTIGAWIKNEDQEIKLLWIESTLEDTSVLGELP